jgi:hypothetical protein
MYIIDIENDENTIQGQSLKGTVQSIPDINVINLKLIDKDYCYALVKSGLETTGGIKIFILNVLHNKSEKP